MQRRLQGQVVANQPCYYTSISMITKKRFQNWFVEVVNTMEYVKYSIIIIVLRNLARIKLLG